jgi:8-oxo-dGTP pyrophosphatase MutT (NUDIX family)
MKQQKSKATNPELTVAAVCERDGRFMLVEERVRGLTVINQPAGHVEAGEALAAAVSRETLEETAWRFEPEYLVGIYLWRASASAAPFLRVTFAGRCFDHQPGRPLDAGIMRVLWLTRMEMLAPGVRLRSPMVLRAVDDYLRGARYPCDLVQDLGVEQLLQRAASL